MCSLICLIEHNLNRGGYKISERGGGAVLGNCTKTRHIRVHARDVFAIFIMKFGGPQKGSRPGSAPDLRTDSIREGPICSAPFWE